ncbi:transglutaminase family protein [Balneatrix alpica]|uniref:transglutaminase family protein n=1 Tax=Balneatrix alpica TaxID=75684 RepID=UPI0027388DE3|nr:transglutaminase family protein [Balneatrix alpica]
MIYRVRHLTEYRYHSHVSLCYNLAHLAPRDTHYQRCLSSRLEISPRPAYQQARLDYFGNHAHYFSIQEAHQLLSIEIISEIETDQGRESLNLDLGISCAQAKQLLAARQQPEMIEALEYCLDSPMLELNPSLRQQLREFAEPFFQPERPLLSCVRDFNSHIFQGFKYDPGFSSVATPLAEVFEHRKGVCQDFAHLAIACLRVLGFPARYVSGYLETLPPPGQEKLVGSDASHAWFAVYSPGEGWFEFDPTNDIMPSEQHITTAWGRDYADVTPLRGVIFEGGGTQALKVAVDVMRIS